MKALKLATLTLCFFLDVHVRAEVLTAGFAKRDYSFGTTRVVLDHGGLIEHGDNLHLVRGKMYVESADSAAVSTPFATVMCAGRCMAIFERAADHIWIKNLEGAWMLKRKGDQQSYAIPEAMQVRVAEVDPNGVAQMDFPQSLPWRPLVKTWGHLYPGKVDEFKDQVTAFRPRWRQAVESAAQMHQEAAQRTIASYEKAQADRDAARRAVERENAELRQLFMQKNYLAP